MSAVADFAAKQNEFNDKLNVSLEGLKSDLQFLNDELVKLQNSQGQLSEEDQGLLDGLLARGEAMAAKFADLDALNPPVAPAEPEPAPVE